MPEPVRLRDIIRELQTLLPAGDNVQVAVDVAAKWREAQAAIPAHDAQFAEQYPEIAAFGASSSQEES